MFKDFQEQTGCQLEHPVFSKLHELIVIDGNFEAAETLIERLALYTTAHVLQYPKRICERLLDDKNNSDSSIMYDDGSLFEDPNNILSNFITKSQYKCKWNSLKQQGTHPGKRGGHQMCIDDAMGKIYLFGGFDGYMELSDFWVYNIRTAKWKLLAGDTKMYEICRIIISQKKKKMGMYSYLNDNINEKQS
jgi:muskelin